MQVAGIASPAVSFSVATLRKRSDFLLAARAKRQAMPGFILQARQRSTAEPDDSQIRIGYTCSKKIGNAVARNRAKRRLREIAHAVIPVQGKSGWDYVLIGRKLETATRNYQVMVQDLETAIDKIHQPRKPKQ
ncbi:MAG: ribonuclease P protein component [Rhodobacteraceae bacterium]|nr:ribonuclease P protein component [Paracoccaceae bacterium]